jgi:hypothetical protein
MKVMVEILGMHMTTHATHVTQIVGFPSKTLPPKMCLQLQQQNGN